MLSDQQKERVLDLVFTNDLQALHTISIGFNFLYPHPDTSLDDQISPLTSAAFLGRREIVEFLINTQYIDLNMQTIENGFTPLCAACVSGNYEIVRMLCEAGADVDKPNFIGMPSNMRTDSTYLLLFETRRGK